jgi:hypothetical protein
MRGFKGQMTKEGKVVGDTYEGRCSEEDVFAGNVVVDCGVEGKKGGIGLSKSVVRC